MIGDLADSAVDQLVQGCDGILHLGGVSTEQPFDEILPGNIVGVSIYTGPRQSTTDQESFLRARIM